MLYFAQWRTLGLSFYMLSESKVSGHILFSLDGYRGPRPYKWAIVIDFSQWKSRRTKVVGHAWRMMHGVAEPGRAKVKIPRYQNFKAQYLPPYGPDLSPMPS